MTSPADSSPGIGLTKTEPAFWPPGWCSRRHRTISASVASDAARSPVPIRTAPTRRPGDRRGRSPGTAGPARCAGTPQSSPLRRSNTRTPTSDDAMSEPCPPAFMRTPPPTDPGTPTAHSRPVRPAPRSGGPAPAGSPPHPPSPWRRRRRSRARTGRARWPARAKPRSATSRFEPRPTIRTGSPDVDHGRCDARRGRRASSTRARSAAAPTDPVGGERVRAARRARPAVRAPRRRGRWRRPRGRGRRSSPAPLLQSGEHLVRQRGDVAAAHRDADVARAQLVAPGTTPGPPASGSQTTRCSGWASHTASTTSLPVTPGSGAWPDG